MGLWKISDQSRSVGCDEANTGLVRMRTKKLVSGKCYPYVPIDVISLPEAYYYYISILNAFLCVDFAIFEIRPSPASKTRSVSSLQGTRGL